MGIQGHGGQVGRKKGGKITSSEGPSASLLKGFPHPAFPWTSHHTQRVHSSSGSPEPGYDPPHPALACALSLRPCPPTAATPTAHCLPKQGGGMPGPLPQRRGKLDLSFVSLSITGVPELTGGQGGVTFILLAAPGQPILKASDLSYGDGSLLQLPPSPHPPRSWLPRADLLCSDHPPSC